MCIRDRLHHARAEVLERHVAFRHQLQGELLGLGLLQVQGDAAVARPAGMILDTAVRVWHPLVKGRHLALKVELGARLDLVDLGAEEGQELPDHRTHEAPAEVGDAHAGQRKSGGRLGRTFAVLDGTQRSRVTRGLASREHIRIVRAQQWRARLRCARTVGQPDHRT